MSGVKASQAKVLVFGRTGQVARALSSYAGPDWVFAGRDQVDLFDPKSIQHIFASGQWDAVVNAAAYTAVDQAESEADIVTAINTDAPALMAKLCSAKDIPFVHISTDYVFDGSKNRPYVEDDAYCPINMYGKSKAEAEKKILAAGGRAVILRTSWVYAPEGKNFVHTMIRLAEKPELKIVSDQIGAPTAAQDIAQGIVSIVDKMLENPDCETGIFHMTGAGETSWHGFAQEIFNFLKARGIRTPADVRAIPSKEYPTPATRPLNSRMDCSKLEKTYGVSLPHWKDSVQTCLEEIFSGKTEEQVQRG